MLSHLIVSCDMMSALAYVVHDDLIISLLILAILLRTPTADDYNMTCLEHWLRYNASRADVLSVQNPSGQCHHKLFLVQHQSTDSTFNNTSILYSPGMLPLPRPRAGKPVKPPTLSPAKQKSKV